MLIILNPFYCLLGKINLQQPVIVQYFEDSIFLENVFDQFYHILKNSKTVEQ